MQIGNFEISKKKYREYLIIDRNLEFLNTPEAKITQRASTPRPCCKLVNKVRIKKRESSKKGAASISALN